MHQSPRNMTLHPHLASVALKRELAATGKRAPRKPSIVDGFCRRPSLAFAAGTVAPPACNLALVAAQAPLAVLCGDARNDSRRATTPDRQATAGIAAMSPRYDAPARLCHGGSSD